MEQTSNSRNTASVVNDFSLQIATVNGSGSQSANAILMRAIFRMGIPVSGKNIFPSNISGLPTWYAIRVSQRGYAARKAGIDIAVALNPHSAREDALAVSPGGVLLAESALGLGKLRDDIHCYEVPFARLAEKVTDNFRLRTLLANMVYVGALTRLLSIDTAEVEAAIRRQFPDKAGAVELNLRALEAGRSHAERHLEKRDPFRLEPRTLTRGRILIDGNGAAALGAMFGGCTVASWYPITPSTSLMEQLQGFMREFRTDPRTGKASFAIIQAEDEMAALGMVVGAGWAGARAMTATSGPGISLMTEFSGLAYFAEIPAVLWDVQRLGPSTGLPTRTSQGDLLSCYFLGHGDTRHILLLPATPGECFDFAQQALNLAERFQTPVICMSDLDLGMNDWVAEEFPFPDHIPLERGKVLREPDLEAMADFARYFDSDGDGVCPRTLPGNRHPAAPYFTRGSGHNPKAEYSERPGDYARLMERLARKIRGAVPSLPPPFIADGAGGPVGIVAWGSTHAAVEEARDRLREEHGVETGYLRLRSLPPGEDTARFLERHERVYVVEQNRDGQMRAILQIEFPAAAARLRSVLHCDGVPVDAGSIAESILEGERKGEDHVA